jgi:sialic acid synthase SpsE
MAVALGAKVFEKHFTLDNNLPGPDHWFSENPNGLMKWVNAIRDSYKILGSSEVKPTEKEKEMRLIARRSIVALEDIYPGELLTIKNIGLRRPGTGMLPEKFERILGSFVLKEIPKGKLIEEDDFM